MLWQGIKIMLEGNTECTQIKSRGPNIKSKKLQSQYVVLHIKYIFSLPSINLYLNVG